jgi:O-antigen/teichoic acid export membrane protein
MISGGSAIINSLGSQMPILLSSTIFGEAQAGLFAMALRVFTSPLALIGEAAGVALTGEVAARLRSQKKDAYALCSRSMRQLFALGVIPTAAAAIVGPWALPVLLGPAWARSGMLVAILALPTLAQFTAAPLSQMLNLTNRSHQLLRWDIARLIAIIASFAIPSQFGMSFEIALAFYGVIQFLLYAWLARSCLNAIRRA